MCLGTIQYWHATLQITGKKTCTSLRTGATEGSNSAHEDNEGHKSSHSNTNDHRHWERFCRGKKRDLSFYNHKTLHMYITFKRHLSFSDRHINVVPYSSFFLKLTFSLLLIWTVFNTIQYKISRQCLWKICVACPNKNKFKSNLINMFLALLCPYCTVK